MLNLLKVNKNLYVAFFFTVFILVGIFVFKDYGISIDEDNTRIIGFLSLEHIFKFFKTEDLHKLYEIIGNQRDAHPDKIATSGIVFDLPMAYIEYFFEIKDSQQYYEFRHLFNFLFFFVSVYFFYLIAKNRYKSWIVGLLGATFLILSPRIFANSFYNNKDLIFMSLFIINLYFGISFLQKRNLISVIIFSFLSSLMVNVRILGIILPLLIISFYILNILREEKNKNIMIIHLLAYFILIPFFTILTWPYLWENPLENFVNYIKYLSEHSLNIYTFYLGEFVFSPYSPWHYSLVWIIVTTPLFYILLFIFGTITIIQRTLKRLFKIEKNNSYTDLWRSKRELQDLLFFLTFLIPLLFVTETGTLSYDGWRHLYFIYPSLLLISLSGLNYIRIIFFKKRNLYLYLFSILLIVPTFYWMLINHPYQYTYFNILAGKNYNEIFEMDYFGVSNKNALDYIAQNDTKNIKIYNLNTADLNLSIKILDKKKRKKLSIVYNIEEADYIINSYRDWRGKNAPSKFIIPKNFNIFYEIKVDNVPINTIYKKQ